MTQESNCLLHSGFFMCVYSEGIIFSTSTKNKINDVNQCLDETLFFYETWTFFDHHGIPYNRTWGFTQISIMGIHELNTSLVKQM